jgi:hypothetical protein
VQSLLASFNAVRQHHALGPDAPLPLKSRGQADAATGIGGLLAQVRGKQQRGLMTAGRRRLDRGRHYQGVEASELGELPARAAREAALQRIRHALRTLPPHHHNPRPSSRWDLDDEDLSELEADAEEAAAGGRREQGRGGGTVLERAAERWCVVACCALACLDLALCWQHTLLGLRCQQRPSPRCLLCGVCVTYCALIAVGVVALLVLRPEAPRST